LLAQPGAVPYRSPASLKGKLGWMKWEPAGRGCSFGKRRRSHRKGEI